MSTPTFANYINGEWTESSQTFEKRNPANTDDLVLRQRPHRSGPSTRELECAFVRLDAGIAEEHAVGKREIDESLRELFAGRRAEQV